MSLVREQESQIDNFYKLKNIYDSKYAADLAKIMNNASLSDSDKRERVKQIQRRCVSCKKIGGTTFEISSKTLKARCNAEPRCELNIEIDKGSPVIVAPSLLENLKDDLEFYKESLISVKIQHALEMIDDEQAADYFTRAKTVINTLSREIASVEEHIIELISNIDKEEEIRRNRVVLYGMIQQFKDLLLRFNETGQEGYIRDAVRLTADDILAKAKDIRLLRYKVNTIQKDDNSGTFRLIQEPYTLEEMTVPLPNFERI